MTNIDIIKQVAFGMLLGALLMLPLFIYQSRQKETIEVPVEVKDTITIEKERIVEHTKIEYITKFDTVYEYATDTDTIPVPIEIPIEHKVYEDTLRTDTTEIAFKVLYSGFKPSLDEIGVSYHLHTQRAVKTKKKPAVGNTLCVGLQVGYGTTWPEPKFSPYVGVGFCYGFGVTFGR